MPKEPKSRSYSNLKNSLDDPLIHAKLIFFSYVAYIIEPFLKKFQTDKPMVPFPSFGLKAIVSELLESEFVVKSSVIKSCKNVRQLKEIDLCDESNLLPLEKTNLGFALDQAIQKEEKSDTVNLSMIKVFKKGWQRYIIATLLKLFERSPLGSNILRSASVLDLSKIISMPRDKLLQKLKMILKCLVDLNVTSPQSCDKTSSEFKSFVDDDLPKLRLEFEEFSPQKDRLDNFFFGYRCNS